MIVLSMFLFLGKKGNHAFLEIKYSLGKKNPIAPAISWLDTYGVAGFIQMQEIYNKVTI